jgi:hypothetical protein
MKPDVVTHLGRRDEVALIHDARNFVHLDGGRDRRQPLGRGSVRSDYTSEQAGGPQEQHSSPGTDHDLGSAPQTAEFTKEHGVCTGARNVPVRHPEQVQINSLTETHLASDLQTAQLNFGARGMGGDLAGSESGLGAEAESSCHVVGH